MRSIPNKFEISKIPELNVIRMFLYEHASAHNFYSHLIRQFEYKQKNT